MSGSVSGSGPMDETPTSPAETISPADTDTVMLPAQDSLNADNTDAMPILPAVPNLTADNTPLPEVLPQQPTSLIQSQHIPPQTQPQPPPMPPAQPHSQAPSNVTTSVSALIDELRSTDVAARINAFHSLNVIGSALGPSRSRDELIPYLSEFIDDDDEILAVLSSELPSLIGAIGGAQYIHVLIPPLEHLATVEEQGVRDKAIASLLTLTAQMSDAQVEQYMLPLIRKLSSAEWFTARISACALYPPVYPHLTANSKKELRLLYAKLCADETPMVRRSATTHLGPFATAVDYAALKSDLFPSFSKLSKDDQDSVRLLTIQAATLVARALKPADNVTKTLPLIFSLCADKSWRVRYMVADKFCEICEALGANESKSDDFVDSFVRLLGDDEAEVRTAAATRVGELSKIVGGQQTIRKLIPPLRTLVKDQSQYVRAALASVLLTIATTAKKKDTYDMLLPLFLTLLKDSVSDVRLQLISRLSDVTSLLSVENLSVSLLPAIAELAADMKWRVRLQIIEHIPDLAKQLGPEFFDAKLSDLCMAWLGDSVYSIREAATANLSKLAAVFGVPWAKIQIVPKVVNLGNHRSYLYRMTAVAAIADLAPVIGAQMTIERFMPVLIKLANDPVPNVRFNTLKCLTQLHRNGTLSEYTAMPALITVVATLTSDSDSDVKYYANICAQQLAQTN